MISIADDVFGPARDRRGHSNETILLTGVFDVSAAEEALRSMGRRFMMVDETGVEHPSMESLEEAEDQDLYSPNYVSEPRPTEEGIELYVDCKGAIGAPMRGAFRRILREELEAAGLDNVSIRTPTSD